MKHTCTSLCAVAVLAGLGLNPLRADTVILKDGTVLQADIKGRAGSVVMLQPLGETRTRMIDDADIAEIRKGDAPPPEQVPPAATGNTPAPTAPSYGNTSPLEDLRFEADILRAGKAANIPEDRERVRDEIGKRWKHATGVVSNKWSGMASSTKHQGVSSNVNHNILKDEEAEVKYLKNGEWVYLPGPPSNTIPADSEGITECWQKSFSSSWSDGMMIYYSQDPRAYSRWHRLNWDAEVKKWVFTTAAAKRATAEKFRKWLAAEIAGKRKEAAQGPNAANIKLAGSYAKRAAEARQKLKSPNLSEDEIRKLEFAIKSSEPNAYERLVWAFADEFERRALEQYLQEFDRRDPLSTENWK